MTETYLSRYSATELSELIRQGKLDRVALVDESVDTVEKRNPALNAVTTLWGGSGQEDGQPI